MRNRGVSTTQLFVAQCRLESASTVIIAIARYREASTSGVLTCVRTYETKLMLRFDVREHCNRLGQQLICSGVVAVWQCGSSWFRSPES